MKDFENNKMGFEKNISDLNEFRNKKLAEEREQKLLKRKELKWLKQKNKIDSEKSDGKKGTIKELSSDKDTKETKPDDDSNDSRPDVNFNKIKTEPEPVSEDDEEFIGPKLPRLMTQEEINVFHKKLLAKYKL